MKGYDTVEWWVYVIGIIVYFSFSSFIINKAKENKAVGFLVLYFFLLVIPMMIAYFFNGKELSEYEKALAGEYYLLPPTEQEENMMLKEFNDLDIQHEERVLKFIKLGNSKEESEEMADDEEGVASAEKFIDIGEKYKGHNPPKEEIINHINSMKRDRKIRLFIVFVCFTSLYIFVLKKHLTKKGARVK